MSTDLSPARLKQEIEELRGLVAGLRAALSARLQVTLRAGERHRFLGQPATFTATVTSGPDRAPVAGVSVTFVTSWGHLTPANINAPGRGTTITVRTTASGTATVKLRPPVSADLLTPQQEALQQTLDLLDPTAATPGDLALGLTWLANLYRWQTNVDLRRAIDIYVRDLSHDRLDPINERDALEAWSYVDALVTAFVQDDSGGAIEGAAAAPARFKDWLDPWLQTYRQLAAATSRLPGNLDWLAQGQERPGQVTDRVYERIRTHVADQPGLIGERTGRVVAENAIRTFLQGDTEKLSPAVKAGLYPSLGDAESVVSAGSGAVLNAVGGLRADFTQEVAGKADLSDLEHLGTTVDTKLATKVDTGTFNQLQTSLTDELATKLSVADAERTLATKTELTKGLASRVSESDFDARLSEVDTLLDGKVDQTRFEGFQTEVSKALDLRITQEGLDAALRESIDSLALDDRFTTRDDFSRLEASVTGKVDVAVFQQALATKVDSATLDQQLTGMIDTALSTLIDRDTFLKFQAEMTRALDDRVTSATFESTLRDAQETTRADLAEMRRLIDAKIDVDAFDRGLLAKVDTDVFERELATRIDTASFDSALAAKVDSVTFDKVLATKVDTTTFDEALATKVDTTTFDKALDSKVDTATLDQRLAAKVDTTTFNKALASRVDTTTLDQRLATKLDVTTFNQRLSTLVDTATLDQRLATKVDTVTFDQRLATKVDQTVFTHELSAKVDRNAFETTVTSFRTQVNGLNVRLNNFNR